MQVLAVQQVASPPESCLFLDSPAMGASGGEEGAGAGALFLHVGAHQPCHVTGHHERLADGLGQPDGLGQRLLRRPRAFFQG